MTKLIIRLGDQVDTIEADTRTKLIAAIFMYFPTDLHRRIIKGINTDLVTCNPICDNPR